MKHVVSVSLGSSSRNHTVETSILGESFRIERVGTDGDLEKAINMIRALDGKIDAFGMGGIDLYIVAGKRRYMLKDARRIAAAAQYTPIVDGTGLKNTLERRVIEYLDQQNILNFLGRKVLLVCGVDRFGMAETMVEYGAEITFGDLIFGLDLPVALKSISMLNIIGNILGPIVSQLPFSYLYPIGEKQETVLNKYERYYLENEIIAGDYLYIKKYLPDNLSGKIILTNTVTAEDVQMLAERGAKLLITTTPEMKGRSFGTNVMEAVLVSLINKNVTDITEEDYNHLLEEVAFTPRIVDLRQIKSA